MLFCAQRGLLTDLIWNFWLLFLLHWNHLRKACFPGAATISPVPSKRSHWDVVFNRDGQKTLRVTSLSLLLCAHHSDALKPREQRLKWKNHHRSTEASFSLIPAQHLVLLLLPRVRWGDQTHASPQPVNEDGRHTSTSSHCPCVKQNCPSLRSSATCDCERRFNPLLWHQITKYPDSLFSADLSLFPKLLKYFSEEAVPGGSHKIISH